MKQPLTSPDALRAVLDALEVDPLAVAEKMTGQSYKTDKATESLGFGLHLAHVQSKRELLSAIGDTHYGLSAAQGLALFLKDGFDIVGVRKFEGHTGDKGEIYDERMYILFCKRRGILVRFETYGRGSAHNPDGTCNSIQVYFNYRPGYKDFNMCGYSGCSVVDPSPLYRAETTKYNPNGYNYVTVGYFDGREGIFTRLQMLEQNGEFVTPWLDKPWFWFLSYADTKDKGYDIEGINRTVLSALPDYVKKAILFLDITE